MDRIIERLRAEHRMSTFDTAGGAGWSCSCGRESYPTTGYPSQRTAYARGERHLRAEARKLLAQQTDAHKNSRPRKFSNAQMHALSAMQDARPHDDQSWIRANTLRSIRGLWWQQNGTLLLTSEGSAAFEAAGGYDATWPSPTATVDPVAPQKRGILSAADRARIVAALAVREAADAAREAADEEIREAIRAAANNGASVRMMAESLEVSTNTISRWKRATP